MKPLLNVVKIGGNVLDDATARQQFLQALATEKQAMIVVHGGGKIATELGNRMGITAQYHEGRRITDEATRDLVTMVYAGLVNKQLVASLQALGVNALGLTGADANALPAQKRPVGAVDYGWVGDPLEKGVPTAFWAQLLQQGLLPVLAPITHDRQGHLLNTNADTMAATIAVAMSTEYRVRLIYCFEKKGVLLNVADDDSVIPLLNKEAYLGLKESGRLFAGMLPKLHNCFVALDKGVSEVVIGQAGDLQQHLAGATTGTLIQP